MGDGPRSRSGLHSPVVHEQVRHPQQLGVDPNVLDVGVLALVPGQVVVYPLLGGFNGGGGKGGKEKTVGL